MPFSSPQYHAIRQVWAKTKWRQKSIDLIAYETGLPERIVMRARRICRGDGSNQGRLPKIDHTAVDWNQSNAAIARKHKVTVQTVADLRLILRKQRSKYQQHPTGISPDTQAQYEHIDWNKRDVDIASEVGRSRERVRQIRKIMKKPKADKSAIRKHIRDNMHLSGTVTAQELSQIIGTSRQCVYKFAKDVGFKLRPSGRKRVHPWDVMNWDLPNAILQRMWRIKTPPSGQMGLKIAMARNRLKKPKPKWDMRFNGYDQDAGYQSAMNAEVIKASEWLKKHPKKG